MGSRELDLIVFGILLGSRKLAVEWMAEWEWEGCEELREPYNEMRGGATGKGMAKLVDELAADSRPGPVAQRLLVSARMKHAKAAVKRVSQGIYKYACLGSNADFMATQAELLRVACERVSMLEDDPNAEVREPGHGGVVEE